jgi:hypothetical protein
MTVEDQLRRLQGALRAPRPEFGSKEAVERMRLINPVTGENTLVAFRRDEWNRAVDARESLENDLRFEYLHKPGVQIEEFVTDCIFKNKETNVGAFVAAHAREPQTRICYLPIESLKVAEPLEVLGVNLLPVDDPSLPSDDLLFKPRETAGSVAKVFAFGTDQSLMVGRAREEVSHALRVMRIAFRAERQLHERQLRFKLGSSYALDNGGAGAHTPLDTAWGLDVIPYLADLAATQLIASAHAKPLTNIDRRVDVAIRWMERATFEPDRLLGILFLFFALESLIGDKAGDLKAGPLSFRQMMLSHIVEGHFTNPITTFDFYQVTRSDAVHGESISEVEESMYEQFSSTMLGSLNQYMEIAHREGFTSRRQMRDYLDGHPDRPLLIKWVRDRGAIPQFEKQFRDLVKYVDSLDSSSPEATSSST